MKKEKLIQAMDEISPKHIAEAASAKKKRRGLTRIAAIAAILALVLLVKNVEVPVVITAQAVSRASGAKTPQRPNSLMEVVNETEYDKAWDQWREAHNALNDARDTAVPLLRQFTTESCQAFLTGSESNLLYSPINAYIGLAMAAELASGSSRQQLLDALGIADTEQLRQQIHTLWESVYQDDGNEICTLANSLWLDTQLAYTQSVMDDLAYYYYTDIYQRDLSKGRTQKDIGNWIAGNTGGFLKKNAIRVQMPEEPILALYSTIYFQAKWQDEFNAGNNTEKTFHGAVKDTTCTFMNAKLRQMHYYWGDSYGAVSLSLKNGSRMWFILPDEGKTTEDVLREGQYWDMISHTGYTEEQDNCKYMKVNLSVPKFDISAQADLKDGLQAMGITDIFSFDTADFTQALEGPACITGANQSLRVAIDEKGVTAAAYIEIPGAGAAAPPEEIIDFILDRPFLFVITSSGIPLFAGAVNQP